jgi:hypothetical protein
MVSQPPTPVGRALAGDAGTVRFFRTDSELNPLPRKLSGYVYKCTVRSRLVIDRWASAFAKKKPQEPSEPPANEGKSRERDPLDGSDGFKAHHFASRARIIAGLFGFLIFSHSVERPDRYGDESRFETTPPSPIHTARCTARRER